MERLTKSDVFAELAIKDMIPIDMRQLSAIYHKLRLYEDTGITPDEFEIINQEYTKMARELSILRGRLTRETSEKRNDEITVGELIKLLNKNENKRGASGKERILSIEINGVSYGYVTSAELDGWGDGLITDICLKLETEMTGSI